MKRVFAFIIAVLYLAVSSGLMVEVHHCMGKIAGVGLAQSGSGNHACKKCGMEKGANTCCKDELKFIKLPESQKPATLSNNLASGYSIIPVAYIAINKIYTYLPDSYQPVTYAPPDYSKTSRCILHCVFRV